MGGTAHRVLVGYSVVLTTVLAGAMVTDAVSGPTKAAYEEIDVQRINIREKDGTLRMVISNTDRMPGIIHKGVNYPHPNRKTAGVLFFNEEGTENGGISFGGRRDEQGRVLGNGSGRATGSSPAASEGAGGAAGGGFSAVVAQAASASGVAIAAKRRNTPIATSAERPCYPPRTMDAPRLSAIRWRIARRHRSCLSGEAGTRRCGAYWPLQPLALALAASPAVAQPAHYDVDARARRRVRPLPAGLAGPDPQRADPHRGDPPRRRQQLCPARLHRDLPSAPNDPDKTGETANARHVAHEFAHAWFLAADPMTEHYWLTESLAEYCAIRYVEATLGPAARDELLAAKVERARRAGPVLGGGRPTRAALYQKAPLLLFDLERRIGRPAMDRILQGLARRPPRTTPEFLGLLEEAAGPDAARDFQAALRA